MPAIEAQDRYTVHHIALQDAKAPLIKLLQELHAKSELNLHPTQVMVAHAEIIIVIVNRSLKS